MRKKLVNTVLAGALGLSMIAGVSAQSTTEDATIQVEVNDTDGAVTAIISTAPDFGTVEYSLENQPEIPADTDLVVQVTDNRGGENGWSVNISGGPFIGTDDATNTFAASNLTLGTGSPAATIGLPGNVTTTDDIAMSGTPGFKLLSALANADSNGIFTVTYTGSTLNVPAGTPVDSEYVSTLTISTSDAP